MNSVAQHQTYLSNLSVNYVILYKIEHEVCTLLRFVQTFHIIFNDLSVSVNFRSITDSGTIATCIVQESVVDQRFTLISMIQISHDW